ncbi:MAG: hypothetical protein DRI57_01480 [Deltaproteobacteria bacterium]|nr:MAG: hypothetical protein DRI57_01480 [Deltaproteobacteria bacterium]
MRLLKKVIFCSNRIKDNQLSLIKMNWFPVSVKDAKYIVFKIMIVNNNSECKVYFCMIFFA